MSSELPQNPVCILMPVLYLWGRDVEHLSDLGVQLLDIGEPVDSACGTPVSQLGVENEPRPWVFWRSRWRWRRGRKRRCCWLGTPLILAPGLLLVHGLPPSCLGVLWAHGLPVLHLSSLRCVPPSGARVVHCARRAILFSLLVNWPSIQPRRAASSFGLERERDELVMIVAW